MRRLIALGLLAAAGYFAVWGGEYSVRDSRRAKEELAARRAELPVAGRQIDSLRNRIDALRHDDEALERFARERYGFIRDGEFLYRVTEIQSDGSGQSDGPGQSDGSGQPDELDPGPP
jgi:cell division protein FtsB